MKAYSAFALFAAAAAFAHASPTSVPASHGAAAPVVAVTKVAKASGPDARTVAEIVSGKAGLNGRTVTVHAQVVKVSSNILGKNWVHLQDGSGNAASGTHDLVVTTKDTPAVGAVVNASGKVRTDVNIGSGYVFAVLVEDAKLLK